MSDIKLAAAQIPVYRIDVKRRIGMWSLADVKHYHELGRIAQMVKRADGAIRRITLKAIKGQIAPRSHRTATVINDDGLPMTWSPNPRFYRAQV